MKITIIGAAGNIGQLLALILKIKLPHGELCLYDISSIILGIAIDLSHIPTKVKVQGVRDIKSALNKADIVIISAGVTRKPGMERSDLLNINANIIYKLMKNIADICPESLICIITNPINTLVPIAAAVLNKAGIFLNKKLFGITTLDVIRTAKFIAEVKNIPSNMFDINVIGGHSNLTILPLLSQLSDIYFTEEEIINITHRVREAGTEIVNAKGGQGSATLAMGYAASRFILSLVMALNGKNNIIECAYVESNGIYAKFFSQPLLLGKQGIIEYRSIGALSPFETCALDTLLIDLNKDISLGEDFVNKQAKKNHFCNF
ncbi:MAG: malate dehydrogenase [Candidatus Dasytiphilus stammeri]